MRVICRNEKKKNKLRLSQLTVSPVCHRPSPECPLIRCNNNGLKAIFTTGVSGCLARLLFILAYLGGGCNSYTLDSPNYLIGYLCLKCTNLWTKCAIAGRLFVAFNSSIWLSDLFLFVFRSFESNIPGRCLDQLADEKFAHWKGKMEF